MKIGIFIFGLMFGSFINALVWRLYEQSKKSQGKNLSIVNGRSQCIYCGHVLKSKDLIPVLSWMILLGKCRYCRKPIGVQYPLVETLTAVVFFVSYSAWPYSFDSLGIVLFGLWLVALVMLIALAVYDVKWMLLPNRLVAIVTIVSLLFTIVAAVVLQTITVLIGGLSAAILLFGIFYLLFAVSDGKWIGGGDVKLAVSLGLLSLSPVKVVLIIFIASLIGTLISAPLLLTQKLKKSSHIPFGPLLITATILVVLFGQSLIDWYSGTFLYM